MPSLGKSLGTSRMTEISRKRLDTSRIALESHRRVWDQQDSCEVSRKSLNTISIAVQSLGRVFGSAGQMYSLQDESGYQRDSCSVSRKSLGTSRIAAKSLGRVWGPAS